ncbi:Fe2+-dependent dioxygenase [Variovorax sp. HJSM1_2]|uniref:Fe2+-dependent dioxygenase n=1 Tax=Variovorax sp. HJSM1_2 TaxID=3366263 RepID=UPI003BD5F45E
MLHLPGILRADELKQAREVMAKAPWADGSLTSGAQAAFAKNNQQLLESSDEVRLLQRLVLTGLERSPVFFSAALPKNISPPMFNRYSGAANSFGNHVDSAIRFLPGGAGRVRTDLSCTLFLSEPDEYEGGELVMQSLSGQQEVKLAAGDLVLYPGTSVHRVNPVTRGARLASFFWIQSMVRSGEQRELLYNMDNYLRHLRSTVGEQDVGVIGLTGTYHNLLRQWVDT